MKREDMSTLWSMDVDRALSDGRLAGYSFARNSEQIALSRAFPPAPLAHEIFSRIDRENLEAARLKHLSRVLHRAAQLPFYRKLWRSAGFDPASVSSVDDLKKAPHFTVDDLRRSLAEYPPFGGHQSTLDDIAREAHVVQFSGGTTGQSRPTLYTLRDRLLGSLMVARSYYAQGVRPGDVAMVSWAYGPHNAASLATQALTQWLGALVIPVSTGLVTSSEQQLEFAKRFGAAFWIGSGDFLAQLPEKARLLGIDIHKDLRIRALLPAGQADRVSEAWGLPTFDVYGSHETAITSFECGAGPGMHIWEDAMIVDVIDSDTGEDVGVGKDGNLVVTSLYNEAFPVIRMNSLDRSRLLEYDDCECGLRLRKMAGFLGRSDTMVRLRGINVWPEEIALLVRQHPATNGEFFCVLSRADGREVMTVMVECTTINDDVRQDIATRIKREIGVEVGVDLKAPGDLVQLTGTGVRTKSRRVEDRR